MATMIRFIGDRHCCSCWTTVSIFSTRPRRLPRGSARRMPGLRLLTTSREPIGMPGEVACRVPSLSLADEAIELFLDRARRARPEFAVAEDNAATVAEICRRLDGIPLAVELAAAACRR